MEKIFKKLGILLVVLIASSCDLGSDLDNPNEVGVAGADENLIMNEVELSLADFFNSAQNRVASLVRQTALTGGFRYQTAIIPTTMDFLWQTAYRRVLVNAETAITIAESKGLTTHVAAAKIMKAYVYLTLVDLFNDVPQAAALQGAGEFNPAATSGAEVYAYAITLLTEARTELAKTGAAAGAAWARDNFYSGNRTRWNALANTLELKAQLNLSQIASQAAAANARIDALLALDLIDTEAENFTYKYGTATVPAGSRHPLYDQYYGPGAGQAGGYFNTGFMFEMYKGKGVEDPRWRYYFYRQVGSVAQMNKMDPKALGCTVGAIPAHYAAGNYPFCIFDPGFYGRDHGDASGTPPDSPVIVAAGVYPAGGKPDTNGTSGQAALAFTSPTVRGQGANGAGIEPIFMACYLDFYKAEILAKRGDAAGAKTALNTAVNNSISSVRAFATAKGQTLPAGLEPSTSRYMTAVNDLYDAAAKKTDVIGREFWIASFGNGIEAYNSYRRTSAPKIMQPMIQTGAGQFWRSLVYPALFANLNSTATQKNVNQKNLVFWDTNPDELN
jgi:hypothetical protein